MRAFLLLLGCTLAWGREASAAPALELGAGDISVGGSAYASFTSVAGYNYLSIALSPSAGYLVSDNVEVFGGLTFASVDSVSEVSFLAGARFLTPGSSVRGYLGGGPVVGVSALDGYTYAAAGVFFGGGALVPLHQRVAIDAGARIDVLGGGGGVVINVPVGVLGVSYWFPTGAR